MIAAGLVVVPDEGVEPRPRFRGRLMFPIYDVSSRVVGFGGRLLGPGEPKYLNSSESTIFSKGRLLYGLNWARQAARRDERMLVVEGYFDALRLIDAGVESVVAPMGTALTEEQAKLIRRYTDRVFLLYDSDKAGLKATFRSGDELLRQGAAVQVVTLPDGEDPDSFVRAQGARGLEAQLASSIDVFERKIQILERGGWFADLRRKRQALDRLLPTLRATTDPLTRDLYLGHASAAAGVSREMLERELALAPRTRSARPDRGPAPSEPERDVREQRGRPLPAPDARRVRQGDRRRLSGERALGAERELVRVLLHRPAYFEQVVERVGADDFRAPELGRIFATMVALGADAGPEAFAERLDQESVEGMQELLDEPGGLDHADEIVTGSLALLHERQLAERMSEIDRELPLANSEEKDQLTREKMNLTAELRRLGGRSWKQFR
jgi:DNA primase